MREFGDDDNSAIAWKYPGFEREVIPAQCSRVVNPYEFGAILDTWTGLNSGITILELKWFTFEFTTIPNKSVRLMNLLEGPTNVDDNYGSRMHGWLVPPVTGEYLFWIASNGDGEFRLSNTDSKVNVASICNSTSATPYPARAWDKNPEQMSKNISLVAEQAYYYEVRR